MAERTGPAETRLSRSGVARRPRLRLQCDKRALRLRYCRCFIFRAKQRMPLWAVCGTKQNTRRVSSTVISGYFPPQPISLRNQPVMRQACRCGVEDPQQCSANPDGALACIANFMCRPCLRRQSFRQLIDADPTWAAGTSNAKSLQKASRTAYTLLWQGDTYARGTRYFQDIPFAVLTQPVLETGNLAELLISNDPSVWNALASDLAYHLVSQLPTCAKQDIVWNTCLAPSKWILRPAFRKVETPIEERMPLLGCVGKIDSNHTVFFLAQLPAPLPGNSDRFLPTFWKRCRINDDDPPGAPQGFIHVPSMSSQHDLRVPRRASYEILQLAPPHSLVESDGLTCLAFFFAHQSAYVRSGTDASNCPRKKDLPQTVV
jgi:hypothetical protein